MAKRQKKVEVDNRPKLVKVGKHLINVDDVSQITRVRSGLYIIKFRSNPNPEYPCWVASSSINALLKHFDITDTGIVDEERNLPVDRSNEDYEEIDF